MTFVSSKTDPDALTLTFVAAFDAPVERVWQVWSDPRQLERWWGPPMWPATVEEHELTPGGRVSYYMTGPDGTRSRGCWIVTRVDAPHGLTFEDRFADENGEPVPGDPTIATVTLEPAEGGTRMTVHSTFASREQLEELVAMGMVEGMTAALAQIDALLDGVPA